MTAMIPEVILNCKGLGVSEKWYDMICRGYEPLVWQTKQAYYLQFLMKNLQSITKYWNGRLDPPWWCISAPLHSWKIKLKLTATEAQIIRYCSFPQVISRDSWLEVDNIALWITSKSTFSVVETRDLSLWMLENTAGNTFRKESHLPTKLNCIWGIAAKLCIDNEVIETIKYTIKCF